MERLLPKTIDVEIVRRFLRESARAYPFEVGHADLNAWPIKLATHADVFCVRRPDGSLSAALFAYLNIETHVGYIPFICALPECEKGTAYRIHESYCQAAAHLALTTLRLEVLKTNGHAMRFYQRQGYAVAEDRHDRWLMTMPLLDESVGS